MTIVPDTKDWTWVLERPCPDCGFDAHGHARADIAVSVRRQVDAWRRVLMRADVARRPYDDLWSPLEYACHVRDVFRLFDVRLHLMLEHDDPRFDNWDQDATAIDARYGDQDPARVATELAEAGDTIAATFDTVIGDAWQRRGRRSDGASFTVETFARYFLHDPVHHLHDVGAVDAFQRERADGYTITDERDRLDAAVVHAWLAEHAYWAGGRSAGRVERSLDHSVTLGLFAPDGAFAGHARWVTDSATFAWLADVFVADEHRGRGLGVWLVGCALEHPAIVGVPRLVLGTRDAHALYAKHGFVPVLHPERWMEVDNRS